MPACLLTPRLSLLLKGEQRLVTCYCMQTAAVPSALLKYFTFFLQYFFKVTEAVAQSFIVKKLHRQQSRATEYTE